MNVPVGAVLEGFVKDFTVKLNVEPAAIGLLPNLRLAVRELALTVQVAVVTKVPELHVRGLGKVKSGGKVSFN